MAARQMCDALRQWCLWFSLALPVPAAGLPIYTHSCGTEVTREPDGIHGVPHGGKRAFYVELVRAILAEMGTTAKIEEIPLARGLAMLQHGDDLVLFNITRSPEREQAMSWVGPISEETDRLYERKSDPTGIRTLEDARTLPVCVLNGNVDDAVLRRNGFNNLSRSLDYEGCFRMLGVGHVRLVASADLGLEQKLTRAGVSEDTVVATPAVVIQQDGYIAMPKRTPGSETQRWNAALAKIRQSGKYAQLFARYAL